MTDKEEDWRDMPISEALAKLRDWFIHKLYKWGLIE